MTLLKNRYQLLRELGTGGFGETFLAEDTHHSKRPRCVVKKLVPPKDLPVETALTLFEREARVLAAIGEGSGGRVPKLYADFEEAGNFYLVQEFIDGETLSAHIRNKGPMDEPAALRLLLELLATLEYVHGRDLIHRDIKPANIVLRSTDGSPRLIDYGCVKECLKGETTIVTASVVVQSEGYTPLEQINGDIGFASDLYALGRTVIFALTGKNPKLMKDRRTLEFAWRPHAPGVGDDLAAILDRATRETFAERYLSAKEFRSAVDAIHPTVVSPVKKNVPPVERIVINIPDPEIEYWTSIKNSTNPDDFLNYTRRYPTGQFVELANNRLRELMPPAPDPSLPQTFRNGIGGEFMLIPAGEFRMGGDRHVHEKPAHQVTIGKPFYLGKYQVTQGEWKAVMENNPSHFKGNDRLPVEMVSWDDCQEFVRRLNDQKDGYEYRLPSEAEWEYACRAGTNGEYAGNLDEMGWYKENSDVRTHPVGQKKTNAWGLHDMHGNVWEWCQDRWHGNYAGALRDGSAWESGVNDKRVIRGGSWYDITSYCRSAIRYGNAPVDRSSYVGFRLVATRKNYRTEEETREVWVAPGEYAPTPIGEKNVPTRHISFADRLFNTLVGFALGLGLSLFLVVLITPFVQFEHGMTGRWMFDMDNIFDNILRLAFCSGIIWATIGFFMRKKM